jgi:hypothetical protein
MKLLSFLSLSVIACFPCFSANQKRVIGARFAAMGGASVSHTGIFSFSSNPAGITGIKGFTLACSHENRFFLRELNIRSMAAALPVGRGCFTASMVIYGSSLYREQQACLTYSLDLGKGLSAGIQAGLGSLFIGEGYGRKSAPSAALGIQARISTKTCVGASFYNPFLKRAASMDGETSPAALGTGFSTQLSGKVSVSGEAEKEFGLKPVIRLGAEYQPIAALSLRGGIRTGSGLLCFGFGLKVRKILFDFAADYHSQLGYTSQISLTYCF